MDFKITDKEQEELREILPSGYAKVISKRLNDAGLQPVKAKEYTPKIVREVMAQNQSDFNVLLELFRYKDEVLTKKEELNKLRNKAYKTQADKDEAE